MIRITLAWTIGLFVLGGLGMRRANRRADAATRRRRWTKFGVYVGVVYAVIVSALAGVFVWPAGLVALAGLGEILRVGLGAGARNAPTRRAVARTGLALAVYACLAAGLLAFARASTPETIVFVYLVVAVFDGFSQVSGQLWGAHRLAPAISPGKTIEGGLGGFVAALGVAWLLRALPGLTASQALLVGSLASAAGLGGDLLASWYKRLNGVKDFGRILPGHGGVLDRFDSLLAAAAAIRLLDLCRQLGG